MSYYLAKTLSTSFDDALTRTTEALKAEGFGVITQIDIRETLKRKVNADFRPYTILGACNPALALEALKLEDKVGTMLPCNVIVQELRLGEVEIAAVDPVASMQAIQNRELADKAQTVRGKLEKVIQSL
ncbi:uncharacterized protein (DUF302 family) [Hephaestia caeni]|jgi:uncharacterized protein (DUF302 family)|uniref:Uncharacterized protein (DUF302 family) n=2 Tax=Alphaproteobacteria TaxID=28211 RepID=A0A397NMH4_9SPHN|nr:DUF302 domain-containing protein [Hephaestia caeni]ABS68127.1 protein of unknown function DUF302 [Xanthobacter autotrophicus Py2]KOX56237.1 hypothetical protein ADL19_11240 [Streptomyces purpurogeneiscleroticus]ODT74221.1 MAG: hypothetical protein ABS76_37520 [Pelagibacterium sp. SCN 64-44]RIA36809.1 uncharacterized protein (DUF302 family) [Hephaestia caeni]